ncbi:hypothetical protein BC829DRAFT_414905 [Chytridium lagenaria]|nr:hypothetical protein BC829DRAFT_414905 [Chytridium lagenaria]
MTEERRISAQTEVRHIVLGGWHPSSTGPTPSERIHRYFSVAYIPKPASRRQRRQTGPPPASNPSHRIHSDMTPQSVHQWFQDHDVATLELVPIGFACVQWFVGRQGVQLAHCHLMGKEGRGMQSMHERLHQAIFRRIEEEVEGGEGGEVPLHIWAQCWGVVGVVGKRYSSGRKVLVGVSNESDTAAHQGKTRYFDAY